MTDLICTVIHSWVVISHYMFLQAISSSSVYSALSEIKLASSYNDWANLVSNNARYTVCDDEAMDLKHCNVRQPQHYGTVWRVWNCIATVQVYHYMWLKIMNCVIVLY